MPSVLTTSAFISKPSSNQDYNVWCLRKLRPRKQLNFPNSRRCCLITLAKYVPVGYFTLKTSHMRLKLRGSAHQMHSINTKRKLFNHKMTDITYWQMKPSAPRILGMNYLLNFLKNSVWRNQMALEQILTQSDYIAYCNF